ncbi:MAG TPA: YgiT-type zinc finger protein [Thermoanaerobaculia bacterium]|nr:YgiT-type zinc finger protein [Thermoanaerobaculia bacterium]
MRSGPSSGPGPLGVVRAPVDLDETLPIGQTARLRSAREVLPMRCLRCQGPVERGTAPVHVERNGYRLAWEDVPAWVCGRCELAYFEPGEVETIRGAVRALQSLAKI